MAEPDPLLRKPSGSRALPTPGGPCQALQACCPLPKKPAPAQACVSHPINQCFLKGTKHPCSRSVFWFRVMKEAFFGFFMGRMVCCEDFLLVLPLAMACPRRAARLFPSPPAACFPGERPPLCSVEHLYPAVFPQSPEELGDMQAAGPGLPRKPHPPVLPCPP